MLSDLLSEIERMAAAAGDAASVRLTAAKVRREDEMILLNPKGDVNLHTHTFYCDGKDSPEALADKAVEQGFRVLGFSGHAYSKNDEAFCMSRADTRKYRADILALKEQYRGKLDIYLGVERDYFGEIDDEPYDYIIGSLHYTKASDGTLLCVDESEEAMVRNVEHYFGGDYRAYVESYYEILADVVEKTGADIVGHFDLVTKFNEGGKYFDENALWYKKAALRALAKVAAHHPIFEINTGAMARGYRTSPYPAKFLIGEIVRLGCPLILSSDCHDRENLNFGFSEISRELTQAE